MSVEIRPYLGAAPDLRHRRTACQLGAQSLPRLRNGRGLLSGGTVEGVGTDVLGTHRIEVGIKRPLSHIDLSSCLLDLIALGGRDLEAAKLGQGDRLNVGIEPR